jgi:tetratricopeptide (TPR) repeat protein
MQKKIEPTYLRYIFDSLSLNTIHKDNISALPEGLIGMYEEAFSNEQNVSSRERFLNFFTAWSLLKKEVSTSLMANLLDWEEWEVIDFISVYTKWFNSPSSGKYLLYHERLRVFFLQKISSHRFNQSNQTFISKCQLALEQRNGDEWEVYALEHLPSHLLVAAMQSEADGVVFRNLVYDTAFWNRQIEINKGYDWSKKMLNLAMTWAAKQNTDELIECALNKIDLHHMEQNDAPRIVELVAQNDIETALQRIESFGGNDKEGLQRKFILYMLCLMELTLLDSKDKPFRRDAIEKILKHFDEKMPVDHSILNWNDFFPSYLMFLIAIELKSIDLDYLEIYKRTKNWNNEWIKYMGVYKDSQFSLLLNLTNLLYDQSEKRLLLKNIASELNNQEKFEEALKCTLSIDSEVYRGNLIKIIVPRLAKKGNFEEAISLARNVTNNNLNFIPNPDWTSFHEADDKCIALKEIAIELSRQGRREEALGILDESIEFARVINSNRTKISTFLEISTEFYNQGKEELSDMIIQEAIQCASKIVKESDKGCALMDISIEFIKQNKFERSLQCANGIAHDFWRGFAFINIYKEFAIKNKNLEAFTLIQKALQCSIIIDNDSQKNKLLSDIVLLYVDMDMLDDALMCTGYLTDEFSKSKSFKVIANKLFNKNNFDQALSVIHESIEYARCINHGNEKVSLLADISFDLDNWGRELESKSILQEAIEYAQYIYIEYFNYFAIEELVGKLIKYNKIEEAIEVANNMSDQNYKSNIYRDISNGLLSQSKEIDSIRIMCQSLKYSPNNTSEWNKSISIMDISSELIKLHRLEDAFECIQHFEKEHIDYDLNKSMCLHIVPFMDFVINLASKGKIFEALEYSTRIYWGGDRFVVLEAVIIEAVNHNKLKQVIAYSNKNIDEDFKNILFTLISFELSKQGKFDKSFEYTSKITDEECQSIAYTRILSQINNNGSADLSRVIIKKVLKITRNIDDDYIKSRILRKFSTSLFKLGNLRKSSMIMKDAILSSSKVDYHSHKNIALMGISVELANQGFINRALNIVNKIDDDIIKSHALRDISAELSRDSKFEKSFECANKISDQNTKNVALKYIALQVFKVGNWILLEKIMLNINPLKELHNCWLEIAISITRSKNCKFSAKQYNEINNSQYRLFYLKGFAESYCVKDADKSSLRELLPLFITDSESLGKLLHAYGLHEIFFNNPAQEKINRLNRTLNIQWALDIANNFNKN